MLLSPLEMITEPSPLTSKAFFLPLLVPHPTENKVASESPITPSGVFECLPRVDLFRIPVAISP